MDENILEQADALAAGAIEAGISKARMKMTRPIDFDGFCKCGAEIPTARIEYGYYNCIDCQSALERRTKIFAR